jgi:hypothetical protein
MDAARTLIASGYAASLLPARLRFLRAAAHPLEAQRTLARRWLARCGGSAYGRAHGLHRARDLEALRARAPVVSYPALRPWVKRAAAGEPKVLTEEPILAFERTSGSTGGNKLIPLTRSFLREIEAATGPWLFELYARRPGLLRTLAYWSVSPAARDPERTPGGHRVGLEDDTEYFGPIARRALSALLAVPGHVARLPDVEAWRTATLRHLLAAEDLGLVSVWSPSFLSMLAGDLERRLPALLAGLAPRRRARAARWLEAGRPVRALWPKLQVISCWTEGPAAALLPELEARFPGVEIQPKGLLATEGVVTLPLGPPGATELVPAVSSHVLELAELESRGRTVLAHEAELGGVYAPVLTTGSGFCRYRLQDRVRCVGRRGALPLLRFEGKLDGGSDLVGEKLAVEDAARALARGAARGGAATFALLAPHRGPQLGYRLYVEGALHPRAFAEEAERALLELHHYRYARDVGQLGPIEAIPVENGATRYLEALAARGIRLGDAKPTPLHPGAFWAEVFEEPGR